MVYFLFIDGIQSMQSHLEVKNSSKQSDHPLWDLDGLFLISYFKEKALRTPPDYAAIEDLSEYYCTMGDYKEALFWRSLNVNPSFKWRVFDESLRQQIDASESKKTPTTLSIDQLETSAKAKHLPSLFTNIYKFKGNAPSVLNSNACSPVKAEFELFLRYRSGIRGVTKNEKLSIAWCKETIKSLIKAIKNKNPHAPLKLEELIAKMTTVELEATQELSVEIVFALYLRYQNGIAGTAKDANKAAFYFNELMTSYTSDFKKFPKKIINQLPSHELEKISHLFKEIAFQLYLNYRDGLADVPQNSKIAFSWCKKATAMSHHEAAFELGRCYQMEFGVEKDGEEAFQAFAHYMNFPDATFRKIITQCIDERNESFLSSESRDLVSTKKESKKSNDCKLTGVITNDQRSRPLPEEKYYISDELLFHKDMTQFINVKIDRKEDPSSCFWYAKILADEGNSCAQFFLFMCYRSGYGVTKSPSNATTYLKLSAANGYDIAQEELGYYHEQRYEWDLAIKCYAASGIDSANHAIDRIKEEHPHLNSETTLTM